MGLRVLVVDDDERTRAVLTELLTDEGCSVDACADGTQALGRLQSDSYDVLLTDLVMPGMDGLELIASATALQDKLRFIVMTGHRPVSGAPLHIAWIDKPIDLERLLDQLKT